MDVPSGQNKSGVGRRLIWVKGVLSLFICYHLLVVLLAPNGENYIGFKLAKYLEPYVGFFEFSNKWSFFAPEPGPPPVFIEYELVNGEGDGYFRGRWPETQNPYFLRERHNRRLASTEFMMPAEDRIEKIMVPFLCGRHPEVHSVRLWRVAYSIPTMEEIRKGDRRIGDEVRMDRRVVSNSFCSDHADPSKRSRTL